MNPSNEDARFELVHAPTLPQLILELNTRAEMDEFVLAQLICKPNDYIAILDFRPPVAQLEVPFLDFSAPDSGPVLSA